MELTKLIVVLQIFYLVYELDDWPPDFGNRFDIKNCLFGAVSNNIRGRGIAFDSKDEWTHDDWNFCEFVCIAMKKH